MCLHVSQTHSQSGRTDRHPNRSNNSVLYVCSTVSSFNLPHISFRRYTQAERAEGILNQSRERNRRERWEDETTEQNRTERMQMKEIPDCVLESTRHWLGEGGTHPVIVFDSFWGFILSNYISRFSLSWQNGIAFCWSFTRESQTQECLFCLNLTHSLSLHSVSLCLSLSAPLPYFDLPSSLSPLVISFPHRAFRLPSGKRLSIDRWDWRKKDPSDWQKEKMNSEKWERENKGGVEWNEMMMLKKRRNRQRETSRLLD